MDKKKSPLTLTIICYVDTSSLNAESIQIINFAKALKSLGHNITLIAPAIGDKKNITGIPLRHIPLFDLKFLRPLSFILFAPFFLLNSLSKDDSDAVICFDLYSAPTVIPVLRISGIPVFLYLNSIISEDMKALGRNRVLTFIADLSFSLNVRLSSFIGCVSEPVKEYVVRKLKKPKERVSVIRDAVDTELFSPIEKEKACNRLNLNPNYTYIGFVGSLCPWHGLDYLISAVPLIIEKNKNVRLLIVGDGEMKKILQEMSDDIGISSYIIWTGFIDYEKIPLYISSFDLCVSFFKKMRSNYGSPMKMFEYLSCARPVVASNCPEYGEFAESLSAGISVNPENGKELSEKISGLLQDSEKLKKMGAKGREGILKAHTWNIRAEEMCENIYTMLEFYEKN